MFVLFLYEDLHSLYNCSLYLKLPFATAGILLAVFFDITVLLL